MDLFLRNRAALAVGLIAMSVSTAWSQSRSTAWHSSLETAAKLSASSGKPLMVVFRCER